MRKKLGITFLIAGAALMISALLLFNYNNKENNEARKASEEIVTKLEDNTVNPPITADTVPDVDATGQNLSSKMRILNIDGYDYIGFISIPAIDIKLPVMNEWDYSRLKISPCRQFGSLKTDDLVIAAHNYEAHFGKFDKLEVGQEVEFREIGGHINKYKIVKIELLQPYNVNEVKNSGMDLVLYTCNYSAEARITVFCKRI